MAGSAQNSTTVLHLSWSPTARYINMHSFKTIISYFYVIKRIAFAFSKDLRNLPSANCARIRHRRIPTAIQFIRNRFSLAG